MKTCEEMAQSVMTRAKAYKRRKCWIISTSVTCICCIILGVVFWGGPKNDQPVTQLQHNPVTAPQEHNTTEPQNVPPIVENPPVDTGARITFLSATGNQKSYMSENVKMPLHMEMRKFDCSGMTEEQKNELIKSEEAYAKEIIKAAGLSGYGAEGYHYGRFDVRDTLITYIVAGHLVIGVDDPAELESIYLETGGAIQLMFVDTWEGDEDMFDEWRYYMDSEGIMRKYWGTYGGVSINWLPDASELMFDDTGELINFEDTGEPIDLSRYSDYIKFVVTFKDGTVEEHLIDILIAEDGKTSAIYRGQKETL